MGRTPAGQVPSHLKTQGTMEPPSSSLETGIIPIRIPMDVLWAADPAWKAAHRWLHDEVHWGLWLPQAAGAGAESTRQALLDSLVTLSPWHPSTEPSDRLLLSGGKE